MRKGERFMGEAEETKDVAEETRAQAKAEDRVKEQAPAQAQARNQAQGQAKEQQRGPAAKPRDTRWTALTVVTIAVFVVQFALCAFVAPCQGTLNTLTCSAKACSNGMCADGGMCANGGCTGSGCANMGECVASGSMDLNAAVANGTCTIGTVPMKCHWSYGAAAACALFGVLAGLGMARLPGVHGRRFAGILAICAAIGAAAFPILIFGTCAAPMSCSGMRWAVLALSIVGVMCGALAWPWCKPRKPSRGL